MYVWTHFLATCGLELVVRVVVHPKGSEYYEEYIEDIDITWPRGDTKFPEGA